MKHSFNESILFKNISLLKYFVSTYILNSKKQLKQMFLKPIMHSEFLLSILKTNLLLDAYMLYF